MSTADPQGAPADTQAAPETTGAPEAAEDTTGPQDDVKAGKEAARYRRQLRETEAERDTLRERVEAMQRAEVERLAGHLSQPSAIWAAGVELADVLDEDGNVDPGKVTPAVTAAAESLGLARASRTPRPDPSQGATGTGPRRNEWAEALRVT